MGKRIDDLSRQLAQGVSRRQLLKGALGGLAAAALASVMPGRNVSADAVNPEVLHCCQIFCSELSLNSTAVSPNYGMCVQQCYQESVSSFYGPCSNCMSMNQTRLCLPQY
jgi:hypothetical protein